MMKKVTYIALFLMSIFILSACWPVSVSFKDKAMPEEWKVFSIQTLENVAPNAPLSYAARLTEDLKDGIQNNTKLKLSNKANTGEVQIEGRITNYSVQPLALQANDVAAKNRLTITTNFTIFISKPKEEEMVVSSSRFADYNSTADFAVVEATLIDEINKQIVQDVLNKLFSNW
jgi:outer membrane lipopolysaccharide assembly protein LptE/RlpB